MAVLDGVAAPARAARIRPRAASRRDRWLRRLPLLPALIYVIVVTQAPFVVTVWYSFQNYFWDIPGGAHFNGLSNYSAVFTDPAFRGSLLRSVIMTASAVIVAMILGVLLATMLDRKFFGRGVARTLIITPFLVMPAAAALIWAYPMLDAKGLQSQPADTLEAAKVDGAGALATFRELTIPHLRPYIELGVLLGSIYLVNTFDAVRLMTNGGPGTATTNLPFFLYQKVDYAYDIGGAAAAGVVTVILTIIVATFALRMFARVFRFEEARG